MLVAYGVRLDGQRQSLAFLRSQEESQSAWEGLLGDLYRRGLQGEKLDLILTDGCAGLAAAIQTVYPRVLHQRCWVHKMRNILEHVRKRDYDEVKRGAQAIYRAESRRQAEAAFRTFRLRWQRDYGPMARRLERDLPELLSFYSFPRHLWKKLRTTNVIERCFVEVRGRTRPMVCFVNVKSVDRIIYSIFQRFTLDGKPAPSSYLEKPRDITLLPDRNDRTESWVYNARVLQLHHFSGFIVSQLKEQEGNHHGPFRSIAVGRKN